jgi:tRNA (pseudouridine54-N1)-methyltransferase
MRTFVIFTRGPSGPFSVDDLPDAGRMDLICRCLSSALFLSYKMRDDVEVYVVLNGPPRPPVTIRFTSNSGFYPDEKSIANFINEILSLEIINTWTEYKGAFVSRKSFQEVLNSLGGEQYILSEKGDDISKIEVGERPIFILGDNRGVPPNEEKFALRSARKISLGKESYLSSSCISILNWICDKR